MAVRRGRETVGSPAGDFRTEPGDRLVMVATADQFADAADLFRSQDAPAASGNGAA